MTDPELDTAIAQALAEPPARALAALGALRDRVQAERPLLDPAQGRVWDALVLAARRDPDEAAALLAHAEGRARWLAAARGPAHPETIEAWVDLGDTAELEYAWPIATRAWEAILAAPAEGAGPAVQSAVSRALRGLGARRLAAKQLDDARALFERDLALWERAQPPEPEQIALSLDSVALVHEQQGNRAAAVAARTRQRAALVAANASASQLKQVDDRLARLAAP